MIITSIVTYLEALQGHCIQRLVPSAEAVELPVQILQDLQRFTDGIGAPDPSSRNLAYWCL